MPHSLKRFVRYTAVGVSTFVLDLGMLYVATSFIGIPYYLATPCTFLIAVSINYVISRRFVFKGTTRSLHGGYAYFIFIALFGALVTTVGVTALVSLFGFYYIHARIAMSFIVGTMNYFLNLFLNFRIAGRSGK
jgi:putative flippase GtrA